MWCHLTMVTKHWSSQYYDTTYIFTGIASFTPKAKGAYQVEVKSGGQAISGSPFKLNVGDSEVSNEDNLSPLLKVNSIVWDTGFMPTDVVKYFSNGLDSNDTIDCFGAVCFNPRTYSTYGRKHPSTAKVAPTNLLVSVPLILKKLQQHTCGHHMMPFISLLLEVVLLWMPQSLTEC